MIDFLIARETRTLQEMLATLPPYAAARTV
jgi:hypothetical protein